MKPDTKRNAIVASVLVLMLLLAGGALYFLLRDTGKGGGLPRASMDDLLSSSSVRSGDPGAVIVNADEPFQVLMGTPVAVHYDDDGLHAAPLLTAGIDPNDPAGTVSKSVTSFLSAYSPSDTIALGDVPEVVGASESISDPCLMVASTQLALRYWSSSDGAMIVKWDQDGYDMAVNAVPLACYLDIPVIVTKEQPQDVDRTLEKLGVKYTILCGDVPGYGKIWPLASKEEVQSILATGYPDSSGVSRSVLGDRLGMNASYVALANPDDIRVPAVLDSFTEDFDGRVKHSDTGSTSFPTSSADAPTFYMDIPENYTYARVTVDSELDCVPPRNLGTPQSQGERSYIYFGIDDDEDGQMVGDSDSVRDTMHFMVPSLGYVYSGSGSSVVALGHTDYPIFNSTGKKCIQIKASLDYKATQSHMIPGPGTIREDLASETTFRIHVKVERLDSYIYPRLVGGSSLAPYLAAFRGGLVLASPSYGVHDAELSSQPNSGDPAVNADLYKDINIRTLRAKHDLGGLLGRLAGVNGTDVSELAATYAARDPADPMYLGILADPFMVPCMYYPSGQSDYGVSEGFGVASDNGYADLDLDIDNFPMDMDGSAPTMELAVGRMTGWNIQDTSALLARTFFYYDILDSFQGHGASFKESAISTHGDKVPVGLAATVARKLEAAWDQAGFTVDSNHNFALSDSSITAPIYETSNFIFECAHGHYYWFVPPGYKGTGPGGGFHVANVRDMDFGPGILYASSCVTGKVDGIPLYNTISQAFIHSGMNCYVGASRLSWGSFAPAVMSESGESFGGYLGLLFYGYLTGYVYNRNGGLSSEGIGDLSVGAALMMAKNYFSKESGSDGGGSNDDTMEEFNIHGDPAFNPYEPNHDG